MSDDPSPAAEGDPLAVCTAVLMTVPLEIARRLQTFLRANDVACRLRKSDVTAEEERAPGFAAAYDVLVRPEDLPQELAGPAGDATDAGPTGASPPAEGTPVALCELPWNAAWKLVSELTAAGIPAAVLEPEAPSGDTPMARRIVPVGVRPADLERARALVWP